jgi:predicted nucleic acid-binding protein
MITAVDTNVLLDVLVADPTFGRSSAHALRTALRQGQLIACDVVWAEVAVSFASATAALNALKTLNLEFSALTLEAALEAGLAWKAYRQRGGAKTRVVADFLIGAHAIFHADRLLTRDRGFYRSCFKRLKVLDPTRP